MNNSPSTLSEPTKPIPLRKRLFSRVTDLIAIAIVIFAGLTMGGSILEWWRTSPEEVIGPNINQEVDELAPPDWMSGQPVRIDVGQLEVRMQRGELTGTADAVMAQMLVMLGEYALEVSFPEAESTTAERELLESFAGVKPQWRDESGVSVYHHGGPLSYFVAVKSREDSAQKASLLSGARVVSWGLVVPAGESRWTAWLFAPKPDANGQPPADDWRDVLPKGANCDLALHSAEGHVMLSFSGEGNRAKWQAELDRALAQREFVRLSHWSGADNPSSARYESRQPSKRQIVTIHIHEHRESNRLQGLLHSSRPLEETP